jgi:hypothetical protein
MDTYDIYQCWPELTKPRPDNRLSLIPSLDRVIDTDQDRQGHIQPQPLRGPDVEPVHSITSSARASSVGGTSRLRALAVRRLMTSSNLVGCTTGRSAGFAPLRIWPA